MQSKIIAIVFAMASEIERELISSRTKEVLRDKKAQGIKLGSPKDSRIRTPSHDEALS